MTKSILERIREHGIIGKPRRKAKPRSVKTDPRLKAWLAAYEKSLRGIYRKWVWRKRQLGHEVDLPMSRWAWIMNDVIGQQEYNGEMVDPWKLGSYGLNMFRPDPDKPWSTENFGVKYNGKVLYDNEVYARLRSEGKTEDQDRYAELDVRDSFQRIRSPLFSDYWERTGGRGIAFYVEKVCREDAVNPPTERTESGENDDKI